MDVAPRWRKWGEALIEDRPALAWLDGLRRRPVTALAAAASLAMTVSYAASGPRIIESARNSLATAELTADQLDTSAAGDGRLVPIAQRARDHVTEQHQILSSWQRLSLLAVVLVLLALAVLAGVLFARARRVVPVGPVAVIATGVVATFGSFTLAADMDQGMSSRALRDFGAAVLLLAFAAAVDQAKTLDDRHTALIQALEARGADAKRIRRQLALISSGRPSARHTLVRRAQRGDW